MFPFPLEGRGAILQALAGKTPLAAAVNMAAVGPALSGADLAALVCLHLCPQGTHKCMTTALSVVNLHTVCHIATASYCALSHKDTQDILLLTCMRSVTHACCYIPGRLDMQSVAC